MPENALANIGFADFVAMLLVETLDSIVASHTSQEERLRALEEAADLTPEEFATVGLSEEMVASSLARLFPDGDGGTSVVVGGPVPGKETLAELGVDLPPDGSERGRLTEAGVAAVLAGLRLYLAVQQQEAMRAAARRGIPRVLVDGGTLRATVDFTAVSAAPDEGPRVTEPTRSIGLRSTLLPFTSPLTKGVLDSIRTTRLMVVQPRPSADPAEPTSRTTITGEVEIRFRTEL
ncbi:hypothetical protein [Pseudactinotalea sp.]|uniref:hypothetical protein n=1 Tax=Pseudactinotalea sp. TaxID=1926260 RepID=UPI003B3B8587